MNLYQQRQTFFRRHGNAELLDVGLRSVENPTPLFFFHRIVDKSTDIEGADMALGRLGPILEARFDIQGEVSFFFTPWSDLHRSTYNAVAQRHTEISDSAQREVFTNTRFTPSRKVVFIVSDHKDVVGKCSQWNREETTGTLVIPLWTGEFGDRGAFEAIASALARFLQDRDLYKTSDPVHGLDFYGRQSALAQLEAYIARRQYVAILGLRRLGKTSIVRQLGTLYQQKGTVVASVDFQAMRESSLEYFAENLYSDLIDKLRTLQKSRPEVRLGTSADQSADDLPLAKLPQKIKRLASRNPDVTFVLVLDEIETLLKFSSSSPAIVGEILGSVRSAAQARANVTLILAGVVNQVFDDSLIGTSDDVDNPIFGQIEPLYITPFTLQETADMLRGLGLAMLVTWSDEAVDEVHAACGGIPYLARELASTTRTMLMEQQEGGARLTSETVKISAEDVRTAIPAWAPRARKIWTGIVGMLQSHHPNVYLLLQDNPTEVWVNEWAEEDPEIEAAALTLCKLGLFQQKSDGKFAFTESLKSLELLNRPTSRPVPETSAELVHSVSDLESMLESGESHTVEFKETCRWDIRQGKKSKAIEHEVVKTVSAFLHADGGVLLIGVNDDGRPSGLSRDLQLFEKDIDRLERWLAKDLLVRDLGQPAVSGYVRIAVRKLRKRNVLVVEVKSFPGVARTADNPVYQRLGNQSTRLIDRQLEEFLAQRI